MKKLKMCFFTAIIALLLAACGSKSNVLTKNSWSWDCIGGPDVLEFYDDGTYDFGGVGSGKYSLKDNKLKLERGYNRTWVCTYEIHGDTLILNESSGDIIELNKVK